MAVSNNEQARLRLIEFGGGKVVTHAQGFVHGPEFWPTVRMVAGFVFGIKAVSTGSRLF